MRGRAGKWPHDEQRDSPRFPDPPYLTR